jgi:hypothetical protein
MGKAEAAGPETAGGVGAGAVVGGLVAAGELGLTVDGARLGVVTVDVDGLWAGCEAVAVTVAVTDAAAVGDAVVLVFFAEQAVASRATTASRVGHQRRGGRPWDRTADRTGGRTKATVPM